MCQRVVSCPFVDLALPCPFVPVLYVFVIAMRGCIT